MQSEGFGSLRRVVVLLGGVLGHEERVFQAAGGEQAAAPGTEEAQSLRLIKPGPRGADAREPCKGPATHLAAPDIESPVYNDVESEARTGAELENAYAALRPVAEGDKSYAADLLQAPYSSQ